MKVSGGISAYAVYKKHTKNESDKVLPKHKPKIKPKLHSANLKAKDIRKHQTVIGLNLKKVGLGLHEDNAEFITKQSLSNLSKLKKKSQIQSPPSEKKVLKKKNKISGITKSHFPKIDKRGSTQTMTTTIENSNLQLEEDISVTDVSSGVLQNPVRQGLALFEWLISPISAKEFFRDYWEKKHVFITRQSKSYYSHLLTSQCLDKIFRDNNLHYTRNVDVVVYENGVKEVMNPEGKAVPCALWDFYNNGCSIRVLNPQSYNKKVHILVTTLQEYFGSMVGVNVYLTPPNSQGFAPHFDDIEAFIIQLEGRKHWKLYHPKEEDTLSRHSSKNFTHDEIGEPFLDVTLEEGSLLYFPRGTIHEGTTDDGSHSLHLTVSVYQNNAYVDLLEKILPNALIQAAKSDIEFRKGLPLHFLRDVNVLNPKDEPRQKITKMVSSLMDKLKDYININEGIEELGRKLVYDSMPPVLSKEEIACSSKMDGDILIKGQVYNQMAFRLSTKIRLTRFHCVQSVCKSNMDTFNLYYSTENANVYHGEEEQFLELEMYMLSAIEKLRKAFPLFIEVGCLPLKTEEEKIQFAYDLWEKGIVITEKPLTSSLNEK